jgi:hypothetical protein
LSSNVVSVVSSSRRVAPKAPSVTVNAETFALAAQHGWGISQRIQQISEDVLQVNQGSL